MNTKYIISLLLIIVSFIFSSSCKETRQISQFPALKISYLKGNTERIIPVKCGEIINFPAAEFKVDTSIIDKELVNRIINQAKSLNPLSGNLQTGCDIKIDCTINLTKGDSIKLCIGDFDCILKDGVLMKKNDTLLYLVRRYSGYYNYFQETSLKYFEELNYFGIPSDYKVNDSFIRIP